MVEVVRERPVDVSEREFGIELCNLVRFVATLFVRDGDILDANTGALDCRCTVTVFVYFDDMHDRYYRSMRLQIMG